MKPLKFLPYMGLFSIILEMQAQQVVLSCFPESSFADQLKLGDYVLICNERDIALAGKVIYEGKNLLYCLVKQHSAPKIHRVCQKKDENRCQFSIVEEVNRDLLNSLPKQN